MLEEQIDQMSDEEAIATTELLGYDEYHHSPTYRHIGDHAYWRSSEGLRPWGELCGNTKGDAARKFLKRHLKP